MQADSDEIALKLARLFATETGKEVVDWLRREGFALTPEWIDAMLSRARAIWSTGGPVR